RSGRRTRSRGTSRPARAIVASLGAPQRPGGVEVHRARGLVGGGPAARRPLAPCVALRIDGVEHQALALVLDPRRLTGRDEAASDGDDLAGEVALIELPEDAVDRDDVVARDAAPGALGERDAERLLVESALAGGTGGVHLHRALAHQARVGRGVIALVEEGAERGVDVPERGDGAEVIEASLSQRAPESLHLAARF